MDLMFQSKGKPHVPTPKAGDFCCRQSSSVSLLIRAPGSPCCGAVRSVQSYEIFAFFKSSPSVRRPRIVSPSQKKSRRKAPPFPIVANPASGKPTKRALIHASFRLFPFPSLPQTRLVSGKTQAPASESESERAVVAMAVCSIDQSRAQSCRDSQAASSLQIIAIIVIFLTSVIGISAPILLARLFHGRPAYNNMVLLIKCFAAGVILSTSLVHVLPDAFEALADCQVASRHPWKDFPFSGFVALTGALAALLVDIAASSHAAGDNHYTPVVTEDSASAVVKKIEEAGVLGCHEVPQMDELAKMKQRLVSQVLEIGIIFHSVIIGVTLGMSQNKCTIRPLVFALSFHQIFEGMGLGGCIAQVRYQFHHLPLQIWFTHPNRPSRCDFDRSWGLRRTVMKMDGSDRLGMF
ncbi:zinc transporter 6 [Asimina triloba]